MQSLYFVAATALVLCVGARADQPNFDRLLTNAARHYASASVGNEPQVAISSSARQGQAPKLAIPKGLSVSPNDIGDALANNNDDNNDVQLPVTTVNPYSDDEMAGFVESELAGLTYVNASTEQRRRSLATFLPDKRKSFKTLASMKGFPERVHGLLWWCTDTQSCEACTAQLVGADNVIVTAGHCVGEGIAEFWKSARFAPGYVSKTKGAYDIINFGSFGLARMASLTLYYTGGDGEYEVPDDIDIAVLSVVPLTSAWPSGNYMGYVFDTEAQLVRSNYYNFMGYGSDHPGYARLQTKCSVRTDFSPTSTLLCRGGIDVCYDCTSNPGDSGAGLYDSKNRVLIINKAGQPGSRPFSQWSSRFTNIGSSIMRAASGLENHIEFTFSTPDGLYRNLGSGQFCFYASPSDVPAGTGYAWNYTEVPAWFTSFAGFCNQPATAYYSVNATVIQYSNATNSYCTVANKAIYKWLGSPAFVTVPKLSSEITSTSGLCWPPLGDFSVGTTVYRSLGSAGSALYGDYCTYTNATDALDGDAWQTRVFPQLPRGMKSDGNCETASGKPPHHHRHG